jgi:hypothetical protein
MTGDFMITESEEEMELPAIRHEDLDPKRFCVFHKEADI